MIKFRLLGQFALLRGDAEVDLGPARQRCVLALLLVHHHQPLTADALIDRIWGDQPPQRAREALYVYITRLRRVLRGLPAGVERQPAGYVCRVDDVAIDLHRFADLTSAAATSPGLEEKVRVLREALALWHDEPLGGLNGEWVLRTRESLRRQWLSAVLACNEAELALGRHEAMVPELSELVAAHPLVEPLAGQLMLALHRGGRHVEALAAFRRTRGLLVQEQGLEPGPALRDLERAILTNDARLDPPAAAIVPAVKPPSMSLPRRAPHFVGRHAELAALDELLRRPRLGPALGLLSGVGGAGKTALALHWAYQRCAEFPDGLHYLDLQGCADGPLLPDHRAGQLLLRTLGVADADIPSDTDAQRTLWQSRLTGRRLLILDNVVNAGQVRTLMPADQDVLILALSRKRMRGLAVHEGARLLPVGPLASADAADLLRVLAQGRAGPLEDDECDKSGDKSRDRSRDRSGDKFARLAELCDCLPLALRIVGCRLAEDNGATINSLLAELSPEEQRLSALEIDGDDSGVRAAFAASLRWVGERSAHLFRFLGTVPGPSVSAAGLAWAFATDQGEIVALLDILARHQLVHQDRQGFYRMHDLVRLYAKEQAMSVDPEAARRTSLRGLASWYLDTAIRACQAVTPGPPRGRRHFTEPRFEPVRFATEQEAMQWFDLERENLAATIRALHGHGWHDITAQLAEALLTFYFRRRLWIDWVEVFETAAVSADLTGDAWLRMRIHHGLAVVYKQLGHSHDAVQAYLRALKFAEEADDKFDTGPIHVNLGALYNTTGELGEARRHLHAALEVPGYGDDARFSPILYLNLGHLSFNERDFDQARRHLRRGLSEAARGHHPYGEAHLCHGMGEVALQQSRYDEACAHAGKALELARSLGDPLREAYTLDLLASAVAPSDPDRACDLWSEALRLCRRIGHPLAHHLQQVLAGCLPPEPEALRRFLLERRFTVNNLP